MTPDEESQWRKEIKEAVAKTVQQEIPIAVAEVLTPMIKHTVKQTISRAVWLTRVGYLFMGLAIAILFYRVGGLVDDNTEDNRRQDCILAGLIRGVETTTKDPDIKQLFKVTRIQLDKENTCPDLVPAEGTKGGRP